MKYRISYSFLEPETFTGVKSISINKGIVSIGGNRFCIHSQEEMGRYTPIIIMGY